MVVGNGMIAKRFSKYSEDERIIIFASGVSNSKNKNEADYRREYALLKNTINNNPKKHLIYFSTCGIYDPAEVNAQYVQHKLSIETFIKQSGMSHNIFRVSNIVGPSANVNTLINYYFFHIQNKMNFDVWKYASRNLIDIEDVFVTINHIINHNLFINSIVNIANPSSSSPIEIVQTIEQFLKASANYMIIEKGNSFAINVSEVQPIFDTLSIKFEEAYLFNCLEKYYSR